MQEKTRTAYANLLKVWFPGFHIYLSIIVVISVAIDRSYSAKPFKTYNNESTVYLGIYF